MVHDQWEIVWVVVPLTGTLIGCTDCLFFRDHALWICYRRHSAVTFFKLKKLQFISHKNEQTHTSQMHHSAVLHQNCPPRRVGADKQPNIWPSMSFWIYQNGNPLTVHMHLLLSTNVCHYDVKQNGFSFIKVVFFRSIHILTAHHRLTSCLLWDWLFLLTR